MYERPWFFPVRRKKKKEKKQEEKKIVDPFNTPLHELRFFNEKTETNQNVLIFRKVYL